jgi:hypothetical protein
VENVSQQPSQPTALNSLDNRCQAFLLQKDDDCYIDQQPSQPAGWMKNIDSITLARSGWIKIRCNSGHDFPDYSRPASKVRNRQQADIRNATKLEPMDNSQRLMIRHPKERDDD